jgi:hypothetical protein
MDISYLHIHQSQGHRLAPHLGIWHKELLLDGVHYDFLHIHDLMQRIKTDTFGI